MMTVSFSSNTITAYRLENSVALSRDSGQAEANKTSNESTSDARVSLSATGIALASPEVAKTSSVPLAIIADSADKRSASYGQYTDAEILAASKKLNEREYLAFGHLSGDASTQGIANYAEAYLKYINSLPPEEQKSVRYAGTKESVTNLLTQAKARLSDEKAYGTAENQKPTSFILMMLEAMSASLADRQQNSLKHTPKE